MGKINGKHLPEQDKPEIVYVFDALCGWCYGFSPVIQKLHREYHSQADFLVLSGGLVRDADARPVSEMADFITNASRIIEETAGVRFGKKFLEETLLRKDVIFSSFPPAAALALFRLEHAPQAISFAARIQKAIYYDGMCVDHLSSYGALAQEYGLDAQDFVARMESDEIREIVANEFRMVEEMGIKGFPSVVLRKGDQMHVIARGYKDFAGISEALRALL